jgi:uncharacterized membrane protein (DUF106 family)
MKRFIAAIKANDPILWSIIAVIIIGSGIMLYHDYLIYKDQMQEQQKFQQQLRDEYRNQIMQEFNRKYPNHPSLRNLPRTYIL